MNVRDRIEALRRQRTSHSPEEMSRLAWEKYARIREELEPAHHGEFVAIEVDSGDWFQGKTSEEAIAAVDSAYPDKAFHLIRIGHQAAGKIRQVPCR